MQGGAERPAGACSELWHLDHIGSHASAMAGPAPTLP
jgi:hypothetical protein